MKKGTPKKAMRREKARAFYNKAVLQFCGETVNRILAAHSLYDYVVEIRNSDGRSHEDTHYQTTVADISVDNTYYRATLTIYPKFVDMYTKGQHDELEKILCHEAAHLRTSKIAELAHDRYSNREDIKAETERLAEIIGRLMYVTMKK